MFQVNDTLTIIPWGSVLHPTLRTLPTKCFCLPSFLLSPFSQIASLAPSHHRACLQEFQFHAFLLQLVYESWSSVSTRIIVE